MSQALYRKYRSKKLAEIVGQAHITSTLDQSIKSGRISHAYLFTGPRGVGKTSIARILAHEINELPYSDESTHLDIIEIDAASNRRIDEIRDLRDRIHVSPTSAKYKVYIIDEVHMLTKEAFNALLKTLEEPPAHVVFILATTEAHKLPETIVSRTQRYHFKTIDSQEVVAHLKDIAKKEGFNIDVDAVQLIAEHGQGSFRDSISLLDQVASGQAGTVTAEDVRLATGQASDRLLEGLMAAIANEDPAQVLSLLQTAAADGISPKPLAHQLIARLRTIYMKEPNHNSLNLMQALLDVESSSQPDIALELLLLQAATPKTATAPTKKHTEAAAKQETKVEPVVSKPSVPTTKPLPEEPSQHKAPAKKVTTKTKADSTPTATKEPSPEPEVQPLIEDPAESSPTNGATQPFANDTWIAILASMKSTNPSLYSVLRMAEPRVNEGTLELHFKHAFHSKRLKESRNIEIVSGLITQLLGAAMPIQSVHTADAKPISVEAVPTAKSKASIEAQQEPDTDVAALMETFGGGEVVDV